VTWMRQNGKRALAVFLSLLMVFSCMSNGFLRHAVANATEWESITDGELLANNYELSEAEKALLCSGLLEENTYVYEVKPASDDNLVSVDAEAKTITAQTFEHKGFVWYPAGAVIVNGDDQEKVTLTQTSDGYVGVFQTNGNTYSVQVTYRLHIYVDADTQTQMLQAGANLKESLNNLDKLAQLEALLDSDLNGETGRALLRRVVEGLMTWVNGMESPRMPGFVFYYPGAWTPDEENAKPVKALYTQMQNNNGDLDLFVMLKEYSASASKTQYLMENGQALLDKAKETAGYLNQILELKTTVLQMIDIGAGMGITMSFAKEDLEEFYKNLNYVLVGTQGSAAVEFGGLNGIINAPWTVLSNNPLKADMTAADYQKLDDLCKDLTATAPSVQVTEKLLADETSVQVNMNRYDITVKVTASVIELNAYDTTALKTFVSDKSALITLNKGATYAEVMAAIEESGVVAQALAGWSAAYQVGDAHYVQSVEGMTAQDTLNSDLVITIGYTPKSYTISGVDGMPGQVPYGYNQTLPKHPIDTTNPDNPDNKKVYDYEINGVMYRQGQIYRVVGDTQMTRTTGESWKDIPWGSAVSHVVSDKAAVVLQSGALNTGILAIRKPAATGCITLKTNPNGSTTVTAVQADSGIDGLNWLPARAYYVCGNQRYPISNFVGGVGNFSNLDYDKVEVEYDLALNGILTNSEMLMILNLPGELAKEAKEQKATMGDLASMKGALEQLAKNINLLKMLLEGDTLTEEGKAALRVLIENCYNANSKQLYIYEYLTAYDENGLAWYYSGTNYENFAAEFNRLKKAMNDFLDATPNLQSLLEELGYGEKYDMVDGVRQDLNSIVLLAPNSAIIRTSSSDMLAALVKAIEATSEQEVYTQLPAIKLTEMREKTADSKRSVAVNLYVDGVLQNSYSLVFVAGQPLKQENVQQLNDALAAMNASLTIDKRFYNYTAVAMPNVGDLVVNNIVLEFSYTAKSIDVVVDGVGSIGKITVHNGDITLPACTQEGFRYQYVINGQVIDTYNEAVSRSLTMEQKVFLLQGGKIMRITINVARQELLDFIGSLNDSLIQKGVIAGASFVPVEDAQGNISIVFKVSPLMSQFNAQSVLMSVAEGMVASSYSYIDMGGYTVRSGNPFHLQGIIDALLDTGFSLDTLAAAINANGTINNMTLAGQTVVTEGLDLSRIPNASTFGGKLMETQMDLATTAGGLRTSVKLYITLGDNGSNAGRLSTLRSGLKKLTPYVNIQLINGNLNLILNLPDKAYQAFLAAMLITDNTQLGNVNDLDYGATVEYLYELIEPLLTDDSITTDSFENTLEELGRETDLSKAKGVLKKLQSVLKHLYANVTYTNAGAIGNIYQQDMAYPVDNLLNKLPLPETLLSVIAEKGGNLEATLGIQLKNLDTDYQALIVDAKSKKVSFVTDVFAAIAGVQDHAVVILVDDINGSITTGKKIYLDLNGKTVNGDVLGQKITLIDSTIGNLGKVTGTFNGADYRVNNLYTTEVSGDNINVYINTGLLAMDEMPQLKSIAFDLAMDLVLNYYTTAALKLDGDVIYSVEMEDIVALLNSGASNAINEVIDYLKCEGLTAFANKLLADLTDFAAMAEAAKKGDKLVSYTVGTQAWSVSISHDKAKDYITGGVVPNATEKVKTLNIYLGGTDAEKKVVIDLLDALGKVVDADIKVELEDISYADRVVSVAGSASASVLFDTKGNNEYAVALAILLANSRQNKTDILNALDAYFENGELTQLKTIVDNTTVAQLFSAIKSVNRSTDFAAMAAALGLDSVDSVEAVKLMETYRVVFVAASKALRTLKVTGPGTKLSSYAVEGENGSYDLSKELKRAGTIKVLGYDVEVDVALKVVLFNMEPSFDNQEVEIADDEIILGSQVDHDKHQIILDVDADGITAEKVEELITHGATNAEKVTLAFDAADLKNGNVINGATVTFTASNSSTDVVDVITYTVILLGDANCDGLNDVGDAVSLMRHVMGEADLGQAMGAHALLAADVNMAQGIDVADAVAIMRKCMNDNYVSVLQ